MKKQKMQEVSLKSNENRTKKENVWESSFCQVLRTC